MHLLGTGSKMSLCKQQQQVFCYASCKTSFLSALEHFLGTEMLLSVIAQGSDSF